MTNAPETVTETAGNSEQEAEELRWRVAELEEQWDQAAATILRVRSEDKGWSLWGKVQQAEEGFSLETVKDIAKEAELQSAGNPLLKRGFEYRHQNVFGKGFTFEGDIKPRFKRIMESPSVQRVLISPDGMEQNERTVYNRGNFLVMVNKATSEVRRLALEEIENRAHHPDDKEVTAYYLRTYSRVTLRGTTQQVTEWYPTVDWIQTGEPMESEIGGHEVNPEWVVVDMRVNVPSQGHWGIPDCFSAMPYAWGYSEYIRDAASMLKALQQIAWKIVGKTKDQAQMAGTRLSRAGKSTAGTAVMTAETQLTAMPRAGQVDMADGEALAAMAATALSVPLNALLNNPSVGGGFGGVSALDGPAVASARTRQLRWKSFYDRVFLALGIKGVSINFPKITEDPVHRQVSSLATGRATGAIWADEYRAAFLEATDVTPLHDTAPEVVEYAQAQNALGFLQALQGATADVAGSDPLSRQGNSGVAGSLGEIDNTNRRLDTAPGTGSQTNLVG